MVAISASSIGSSSSATARFREDCADMVRTRGEGVGMVLMGAACREESTSAMPFPSAALCLGPPFLTGYWRASDAFARRATVASLRSRRSSRARR